MASFRLRTNLELSLLLISACLTCATLLILYHIKAQVRRQISEDLQNSIAIFRNVLHEGQVMRARSAGLISELPPSD